MRRICAIHQPNFFPWLGYFDKIKKCDVFVILDHVQYPKSNKGTWSNRTGVVVQGKKKWITAPIERKSGYWNINETKFKNTNWRNKIIKTLEYNYSKAKFYKKYKEFIFNLINFNSNHLVEYNLNAINQISTLLGIDFQKKVVLSSSLKCKFKSTMLLIEITKKVGCTAYLAGGGAKGYQQDELFKIHNVELIYQNFQHPHYEQVNTSNFIEGLSVIDFIFNCGIEI